MEITKGNTLRCENTDTQPGKNPRVGGLSLSRPDGQPIPEADLPRLRKQLALFQERKIKARRADDCGAQ